MTMTIAVSIVLRALPQVFAALRCKKTGQNINGSHPFDFLGLGIECCVHAFVVSLLAVSQPGVLMAQSALAIGFATIHLVIACITV